jgi:hypothetical protein
MTQRCVVCKRITPKQVFSAGHKIFDAKSTKQVVHQICVDAVTLVNMADSQNRLFFCGKSQRGLLAGLFYLLSFKHNVRVTQLKIADSVNLAAVTVRLSYQGWMCAFPEWFRLWDRGDSYDSGPIVFGGPLRSETK